MNMLRMKLIDNEKHDNKYLLLKVFLLALAVRLITLCLVYILEEQLGLYLFVDDRTYEEYAIVYSNFATQIFDPHAFQLAEYSLGGTINVAKFFFNYNAILYQLTQMTAVLRLSNVVLSSLSVVPIFYLTRELFSKKEAIIAAMLFALIPYNVVMSVFLFKDIMIILILSTQLYFVMKYFNTGYVNPFFFLLLIPMPWIRDGLSLFVIGLMFLSFIVRNYHKNKTIRLVLWIGVPIVAIIALVVFSSTITLLFDRFAFYLDRGRDDGAGIALIRVDSIKQLYKLPLTWIFSTFMPISFNFELKRWFNVMEILNYTLFLISPAYLIFMIFGKKEKRQLIFFLPMLMLHLLVIILVINIPRHYYFLNFYMIIGASAYLAKLQSEQGYLSYAIIVAAELFIFMLAVVFVL